MRPAVQSLAMKKKLLIKYGCLKCKANFKNTKMYFFCIFWWQREQKKEKSLISPVEVEWEMSCIWTLGPTLVVPLFGRFRRHRLAREHLLLGVVFESLFSPFPAYEWRYRYNLSVFYPSTQACHGLPMPPPHHDGLLHLWTIN